MSIQLGTIESYGIKKGSVEKCDFVIFISLKVRNSGRNHERIVVSTAKILGQFSEKTILQQTLR